MGYSPLTELTAVDVARENFRRKPNQSGRRTLLGHTFLKAIVNLTYSKAWGDK